MAKRNREHREHKGGDQRSNNDRDQSGRTDRAREGRSSRSKYFESGTELGDRSDRSDHDAYASNIQDKIHEKSPAELKKELAELKHLWDRKMYPPEAREVYTGIEYATTGKLPSPPRGMCAWLTDDCSKWPEFMKAENDY